jgi:hypothetical protein
MAVTADNVPSATANSYASLVDTKAIWDNDPYKNDYTAFPDDDISRALISATSQLDGEYGHRYKGLLFDDTFALFYPRTNIVDSRGVSITDFTIFPPEVALAASTQAWYILQSDREAEVSVSGTKKQKMDGLGELVFFSPSEQQSVKVALIHSETRAIINPYVTGGTSQYVTLVGRG